MRSKPNTLKGIKDGNEWQHLTIVTPNLLHQYT